MERAKVRVMDWIAANWQTLLYGAGIPIFTAIFVYKIAPKISHRLEIKRTYEVPFQKWAAEACDLVPLDRSLVLAPAF